MHVVSKTCKRKYYVEECCIITFSLCKSQTHNKEIHVTEWRNIMFALNNLIF